MADDKEKKERTLQRTYRLPAEDVQTIEDLARHGMLGSNRSAVVRTLLSAALKDLTEKEYVKKKLEERKLLKDGG